jgi:outer membrane immunogenic protein
LNKITAYVTAIAVLIAAPAFAADMAVKMPVKAPPPAPAPVYSWTGFYVGGNAGYSWGRPDSDTTLTGVGVVNTFGPFGFAHSDPLNLRGVIGGAQIGYNWQASQNWVYGLETDWQASGEKAALNYSDPYAARRLGFQVSGTANTNYDAKILWFGTVRGRIGYAWGHLLVYATGGLAYGQAKLAGTMTDSGATLTLCGPNCPPVPFSATAPYSASRVNAGWTAGTGVEGALVGRWTWKAEYLYVDLGALNLAASGPFAPETITVHARLIDNIVRVGLNYQFH